MVWQPIIKNLVYTLVLCAALFVSFVGCALMMADPPAGKHLSQSVGWVVASVMALAVSLWVAVAGLNRWRKKP